MYIRNIILKVNENKYPFEDNSNDISNTVYNVNTVNNKYGLFQYKNHKAAAIKTRTEAPKFKLLVQCKYTFNISRGINAFLLLKSKSKYSKISDKLSWHEH